MNSAQALAEEKAQESDEQQFVIRGMEWAKYRKISEALEGRHIRLTYDRGRLEFMTISGKHGNLSRLLGRLIAVLTEVLGLPLKSFGDMTCDREDLDQGLEPDECFYITNEALVRGNSDIDLTTDPPPDLAVEVDLSRSLKTRLALYAAIRVLEVWRYDGQALSINQLGPDGQYLVTSHSRFFPFLTGPDLVRFLDRRTQTDENSLIREFRDWVREQLRNGQ